MYWMIHDSVDMALAPVKLDTPAYQLMYPGDKNAHQWTVDVLTDGEAADLSGATVTGYFCRYDRHTVIVTGTVSGNTVTFVFPEQLYAIPGMMLAGVRLAVGQQIITLLTRWFDVKAPYDTDQVVDPGEVIPDLAELLEQIVAMEEATAAAEAAAMTADTAAASLISVLPGWAIPWESGSVTRTDGILTDAKRCRMAYALRTKTPLTITSTTQIVWAVYDLNGNRLSDECQVNWSTGTFAIKADRLFQAAFRKSDNTNIAYSERAALIAGISFSFAGDVAEVLAASTDANGNHYPTLGDTIINTTQAAAVSDDLALSLVTLLKNVAYTSDNGSALLSSVANALTKTVATVTNFEQRQNFSTEISKEYLNNNTTSTTTLARYFPVDGRYNYKIKADLNTSAKVWVKLLYLNATSKGNIDNRQNYSSSDASEVAYAEMVNGEFSFTPNGVTVNGSPAVAVRLLFGFGTTAEANNVSLAGTEIKKFTFERTVRV